MDPYHPHPYPHLTPPYPYPPPPLSQFFSEGDVNNHWSSTRYRLKNPTPYLWDQPSFLRARWASIEADHIKIRQCPPQYHEGEQVSRSVRDQVGAHQANWTPYYCPDGQRWQVTPGYRLVIPENCPRLILIIAAAAAACWHIGTRTETFITGFIFVIGLLHLRNRTTRVVEAGPGLINKYHIVPVMMVPARVPVCQHRWRLSGVSLGHLSRYPECYQAATKRLCTIWTKAQHPIRLMSSILIRDGGY